MLIGFIGKMGSGKTTAADYVVEHYQYTKTNFKDALDAELLELYPNVLAVLGGGGGVECDPEVALKCKPTIPSVRELKQKHGTDIRRAQDVGYWVKRWVETYTKTFGKTVVDDVRFLNEVDVIKKMGGIIVRIERDDITDTGTHASETALDDYEADITINAEKGDLMMVYMSLDNIIDNDLGREKDSDDSSESHRLREENVGEPGG